ncbi:MFS transporter [Paracoccaceae bacterium Fryx2]|nr:MFS transporter [Paracoccaceae bacterium Fryx2]
MSTALPLPAARATRQGRLAVAAMFLANGFVMGSWAPQIPLLLPRHGIGTFTVGLLILMLGVGAVAAMALSGGLIARHGSRAVLRGFALPASVTLAAVVLAPSLPLLTLAMVAMGALIGCMDVAMNANAVEVERRLGRAIMSSSHGFWSLGGFLGGGLGGGLIAAFGAGGHALIASAVTLGVVALAAPFLTGDPPAPAPPGRRAPRTRRDAAIWIIGAMALFSMVPEGAVLDWSALYLAQELGAPVAASGLAFGFFAGAMAVMRFLGDAVRNRFGGVPTLRLSGAIGALGLLGASLAPTEALAVACFALCGLGLANMVPILLSAAGNHPGLGTGVGISTVTMLGYSGILVAPSSIGFVAEHIGFRVTFGVLALLLLVVAAMASRAAAADQTGG